MQDPPVIVDVYAAHDVTASEGVTKGEPLSFADELVLDDVFRIAPGAATTQVPLITTPQGLHRADASQNPVHLDCCLTLIAPDGSTHEALILVEVEEASVAALFLLPLGELLPQIDYRLVGVERHTATKRFAEAASGSFAKGTRITMHDGTMTPVEALTPGDLVLTRDAGKQPLRWLRRSTLRATGSFAPVVISAGALHNEADLVLRPDHRLFVYQRQDRLGVGRAEVLIKARHLVDGQGITRRRGGFVDYFQLIFVQHHIIYAEGIAAESHLIDSRTRAALPEGLGAQDHQGSRHVGYEVKDNLIPFQQAAALLRKASSR